MAKAATDSPVEACPACGCTGFVYSVKAKVFCGNCGVLIAACCDTV